MSQLLQFQHCDAHHQPQKSYSVAVLSYVKRDEVDNKFTEALNFDKQIIVYGSSKQGKTALVSKYSNPI